MAICAACGNEMSGAGISCRNLSVRIGGKKLEPIKYGDEPDDWGAQSGANCHDCNCPPGGYHHPGCDAERCPSCGFQLISCGCHEPEEYQQ